MFYPLFTRMCIVDVNLSVCVVSNALYFTSDFVWMPVFNLLRKFHRLISTTINRLVNL